MANPLGASQEGSVGHSERGGLMAGGGFSVGTGGAAWTLELRRNPSQAVPFQSQAPDSRLRSSIDRITVDDACPNSELELSICSAWA